MTHQPLRWGYLPLADSLAALLCCKLMTQEGILWEPVKFANNHLLLEALRKGEIDGGISSAVFLPELAQDRQMKILGAASREGVTIFASRGGKYQDLSDLKGATVSLPAKLTVHGALLYKLLTRQGLTWGQEVKIKILSPPEGFKALAQREVDLVPALEPLASRMEAEENFTAVAHSRDFWPRHLSFIALISTQSLSQNPHLEEKWGEAYQKAGELLSGNYQEVAQETAPLLGSDVPSLLRVLPPDKPKILYEERVIKEAEKREWHTLVERLKA